mmetsp:Transcript_988/g.1913  ORF Transcript_988/g.1913 Transcript_988/m.1913 type:complete len:126 (+) Transcript_988:1839-2216(+)
MPNDGTSKPVGQLRTIKHARRFSVDVIRPGNTKAEFGVTTNFETKMALKRKSDGDTRPLVNPNFLPGVEGAAGSQDKFTSTVNASTRTPPTIKMNDKSKINSREVISSLIDSRVTKVKQELRTEL